MERLDEIVDLPSGVRVAHISDTHVGYEAYRVLAGNGENQRGVDIARAFARGVDEIIAWDPPLVVHSGDVAERPQIPVRHMLFIRQQLAKLASIRPDGTRRQVVVIAGNHDLPAQRREACFLELYRDLPGVHIVTDGLRVVEFPETGEGAAASELSQVALTCVPHDTLKDLAVESRYEEVAPVPGKLNILVAHGVAGGSTLYKRVLGREYTIPTEVLGKGWEYGALGHWHRQGPVPLASTQAEVERGRVWYAGSPENMGFGDLLDNGTRRGWLQVTLVPGGVPEVTRKYVPNRAMHRLPVLDGAGMDAQGVEKALRDRIAAAVSEGRIAGAVVGQIVRNTPREVWSLVDIAAVRTAASGALHYEVGVEPVRRVETENGTDEVKVRSVAGLAEIRSVLADVVQEELGGHPGDRRSAVLGLAEELLESEMRVVGTEEEGSS
jgi:DNA repair exonuclease SbcCD nuclease subunit